LLTRLITCRRGVAAIEFAFIAPILLALMFGAVEYGRYVWIQDTMQHGVEDAARYGVFQFNLGNSQWQTKTSAYATDKMYGLTNLTVTVSPTAVVKNGISVIEVTASYQFQPIIPAFSMAIAGTITAVARQPTGS
jgi:Flp pilus assembly protein TadG